MQASHQKKVEEEQRLDEERRIKNRAKAKYRQDLIDYTDQEAVLMEELRKVQSKKVNKQKQVEGQTSSAHDVHMIDPVYGATVENLWESDSKILKTHGNPIKNLWPTCRKPIENLQETFGKPTENL